MKNKHLIIIAIFFLGSLNMVACKQKKGTEAAKTETKVMVNATDTAIPPRISREFIDRLEYLGVILDRPGYHTWGTSVVQGDDGKFHMYACQWSTEYGYAAWNVESEVNYFIAENPEGPYTFIKNIIPSRPGGDKEGVWNRYTAHNPEVKRIDGKYVLTYLSYPGINTGAEGKIGLRMAEKPGGPWKDCGMIMQKSLVEGVPSYNSLRGTDNPSLVKFNDKYYLFFMYNPRLYEIDGRLMDNTSLGVAVAESLEGPYVEQTVPVFAPPPGKKVEDLCAFVSEDGNIVATMCDNFGMYAENGGIYCEMDQSHFAKTGEIKMTPTSVAWETRPVMFPEQDFSKGKAVYANNKFERPKVIKVDGVPAYMFLPSGFNAKGDPWTVLHGFRIQPEISN